MFLNLHVTMSGSLTCLRVFCFFLGIIFCLALALTHCQVSILRDRSLCPVMFLSQHFCQFFRFCSLVLHQCFSPACFSCVFLFVCCLVQFFISLVSLFPLVALLVFVCIISYPKCCLSCSQVSLCNSDISVFKF